MQATTRGPQCSPVVRQGDVLLEWVPYAVAIRGGEVVDPTEDRLILAYGERTGHHHSVPAKDAVLMRTSPEAIFLQIMNPTKLEHHEHGPITLEPGVWRVRLQQSYEPDGSSVAAATWE
jgi:hypothetical protein